MSQRAGTEERSPPYGEIWKNTRNSFGTEYQMLTLVVRSVIATSISKLRDALVDCPRESRFPCGFSTISPCGRAIWLATWAFGTGITLLGWQFDTAPLTADVVPPAKFYLFLFATLAVPIWLTWLATILALISTASMVPDFLASGPIELTLARPISRLRLFTVKCGCGLLFVALQVAVFAVACFLVVGLRGGSWDPRIFLAVPIVVLFFGSLFSFCVLFGLGVSRPPLSPIPTMARPPEPIFGPRQSPSRLMPSCPFQTSRSGLALDWWRTAPSRG